MKLKSLIHILLLICYHDRFIFYAFELLEKLEKVKIMHKTVLFTSIKIFF